MKGDKVTSDNSWVTKWLVGAFWGVISLILLCTVNGVVANDRSSRNRDSHLSDKCITRNQCVETRVNALENIVGNIQTDMEWIKELQVEANGKLDKLLSQKNRT